VIGVRLRHGRDHGTGRHYRRAPAAPPFSSAIPGNASRDAGRSDIEAGSRWHHSASWPCLPCRNPLGCQSADLAAGEQAHRRAAYVDRRQARRKVANIVAGGHSTVTKNRLRIACIVWFLCAPEYQPAKVLRQREPSRQSSLTIGHTIKTSYAPTPTESSRSWQKTTTGSDGRILGLLIGIHLDAVRRRSACAIYSSPVN